MPHPVHSFPVKSTFSSQEFTFGAVQCQPGGWDTEEREALSIFSSFHSFLLHSVTEFSYLDFKDFPEIFLFPNTSLIIDLVWEEKLGFLTLP